MSNILSSTIEKLLFHPVTVTDVDTVGSRFQLVSVQGEGLHGVTWTPGQTIQFYIGSFTKRAYTPMDLSPKAGSARFLLYLHGRARLGVGGFSQAGRRLQGNAPQELHRLHENWIICAVLRRRNFLCGGPSASTMSATNLASSLCV